MEAGCGAKSHIKFKQNAYIVGIEISEKQLQRNTTVDEKILGDIQFYDLQPSTFDVIISWCVLEHVPKPKLALKNFLKALKEEGIIVLVLPNVMSLKGLLTKFTPHRIHILVHRYIFKKTNAGKGDTSPFKTYMRFSISPTSINKFASSNGFRIEYFCTNDVLEKLYRKNKLVYYLYCVVRKFFEIISFGKIGDSEFMIVLKKCC